MELRKSEEMIRITSAWRWRARQQPGQVGLAHAER
jgi:hypothetical protein